MQPSEIALAVETSAARVLPADFYEMAPAARMRILDEIRARALLGVGVGAEVEP